MDASKYDELGTILIQSNCPIPFASKMLTDIETHYVNIERECLSVCFSLEKFHTYIYGRHVMVENDHKQLEMIQHKPIHVAPPQLQWMLLCMQKCDYTIKYKSSKDILLANQLSHFPPIPINFPFPLPTMSTIYSYPMLIRTSFEAWWNATQCIAPSIISPFEDGLNASRKFPTLPDISGV